MKAYNVYFEVYSPLSFTIQAETPEQATRRAVAHIDAMHPKLTWVHLNTKEITNGA